jgi:signal transduction histidine kinase
LCLAQEIKNPLVAIRTFTQLFPESYADENFRNEFSNIALREIDKLDGIVERLLRFSQPIEVRAEPDDIYSVIDEEINRVKELANDRHVVVEKAFELANGRILFDRFLLKEALVQIFDNALESMPSGGTLTVSTRTRQYPDPQTPGRSNGIPPGPVAEIRITDTGVGIAPEEMPNLFKPFHTSKVKGMGLGLPISRRIVREHSGDITVTSTPNGGTTVTVILPQRKTPDA